MRRAAAVYPRKDPEISGISSRIWISSKPGSRAAINIPQEKVFFFRKIAQTKTKTAICQLVPRLFVTRTYTILAKMCQCANLTTYERYSNQWRNRKYSYAETSLLPFYDELHINLRFKNYRKVQKKSTFMHQWVTIREYNLRYSQTLCIQIPNSSNNHMNSIKCV